MRLEEQIMFLKNELLYLVLCLLPKQFNFPKYTYYFFLLRTREMYIIYMLINTKVSNFFKQMK